MSLAELLKQKADLERQIQAAQSETRAKAIADVRELMSKHGLTVADLASMPTKRNVKSAEESARKPVAAKYKDAVGNQWSGRGLKPKWLAAALAEGKTLQDFAI